MRDGLLIALAFGVLFWLGGISPLGADGLTNLEVRQAYWMAWDVSNSLEAWSDYLVDGVADQRPDEAEWNRVFAEITQLIELLCKQQAANTEACRYPGY